MTRHPFFEVRNIKWPFKKNRFAVRRYKWEDPAALSESPRVLRRTIDIGGISLGIRYESKEQRRKVSEVAFPGVTRARTEGPVIRGQDDQTPAAETG